MKIWLIMSISIPLLLGCGIVKESANIPGCNPDNEVNTLFLPTVPLYEIREIITEESPGVYREVTDAIVKVATASGEMELIYDDTALAILTDRDPSRYVLNFEDMLTMGLAQISDLDQALAIDLTITHPSLPTYQAAIVIDVESKSRKGICGGPAEYQSPITLVDIIEL